MGLFSRRKKEKIEALSPELTVILRHGEDGYIVAECVQLPGCMSQGKNEDEAKRNIIDAIQSCLAVRIEQMLRESCQNPTNLVGIEAQENLRIKPLELVPA
jgi:predicted RNase H-like HicB family nuclease